MIHGLAMAAADGAASEAISNTLVAVEAQFTDKSSRRGQAFAVANHLGGVVVVTANSVVRSDQPYNFTVTVIATSRREGFSEPDSEQITLAEIFDWELNLGLLYERGSHLDDWPQTSCLVSELPRGSAVTIWRRDATTGEAKSVAGHVVQGFDEVRAVVQIAPNTERIDELLGAPVLLGDKFVGVVIEQSRRESDVDLRLVSASDLGRFLAKNLMRFEFEPSVDCFWSMLPAGKSVDELRRGVIEAIAAQRPWGEIRRRFSPSDADLLVLFGTGGAERARKALGDGLSNLAVKESVPSIKGGVMTKCYKATEKTEKGNIPDAESDSTLELQLQPGTLACRVHWEAGDSGADYELAGNFVFINGHWIWLP